MSAGQILALYQSGTLDLEQAVAALEDFFATEGEARDMLRLISEETDSASRLLTEELPRKAEDRFWDL